jgi:hypothetical protein
LETFDPKPAASRDYNGGLKAIPTNVPGIEIHEWWPNLAGCADLYSIIRTMTHRQFGHETAAYLMQTGRLPGGGEVFPALGTVVAEAKRSGYRGDLPPSVVLTRPKGRFSEVGFLGVNASPLVTGGNPNAQRFAVDGIVPPEGLDAQRVKERFELLNGLDLWSSEVGVNASMAADFDSAGAEARRIAEGDAAKVFALADSFFNKLAASLVDNGEKLLPDRVKILADLADGENIAVLRNGHNRNIILQTETVAQLVKRGEISLGVCRVECESVARG